MIQTADILAMGKNDLLNLDPENVLHELTKEEVVHIARVLGAFWSYNYEAAENGKLGMHAKLKSENHSDGFFVSKILLEPDNICTLISIQLIKKINERLYHSPDVIVGIPDGATKLGKFVARLMGTRFAEAKKIDGKITYLSDIKPGETILSVEDFCTKGTGFREFINSILYKQPKATIIPKNNVIINRGGLSILEIEGFGSVEIVSIANCKIDDWEPEECPLCKWGSKPIKPKASDENWLAITTSQ